MEIAMVSTVLDSPDVYINDKGYAWMMYNGKTIVRKVTSTYFSNFPKETVRINNRTYLLNRSVLNVYRAEAYTAPYVFI